MQKLKYECYKVLIPVATSWIGLSISEMFTREGATVIGLGRKFENTTHLGDHFIPFKCDVTDLDNLQLACDKVKELFDGELDVLINSACIRIHYFPTNIESEKFDFAFNLLLKSFVMMTKYALFISSGVYETFFNNCMFPLRIDTKNNELFKNISYQLWNKKINFKEKVSTIGENKFVVLEDVSNLKEYNALLQKQLDDIISNKDILEKEKEFKTCLEVVSFKKLINERAEKKIDKDIAKINKLVYSLNDNFDKNNRDLSRFYKRYHFYVPM